MPQVSRGSPTKERGPRRGGAPGDHISSSVLASSELGRRYLMKRISAYFGSGQRSSGDDPLELVGDLAHRLHRRDDRAPARTWRPRGRPRSRGGSRVGLLEREDRLDELVDQAGDLGLERARRRAALGVVEQRQVRERRREQHRAGDRRGRLGLDVDRGHVLLDEDLVARLELALGEHVVASRTPRRSARRSATAARPASGARLGSPRSSASSCHSSE